MRNRSYLYVAYNRRSCVTGRALFEKLKELKVNGFRLRRSYGGKFKQAPEMVIIWGQTLEGDGLDNATFLNTSEAVMNTSDKLKMAELLIGKDGVTFPKNSRSTPVEELRDENGKFFVRDQYDHIKYTDRVSATDRYVLENINKGREFRVHVFNEKIIGVYEKLPHEGTDGLIRKDNNCDFVRLDMANRDVRHAVNGVRPQAKAAVDALGLLYGGVDVAIGADGNPYVLEVNSAPALNEPNIERWAKLFKDYIEHE